MIQGGAYVCGQRSKQHVVSRRWWEKSGLAMGEKVVQNSRNFFSPKMEWREASTSTVNPEEKEFMDGAGASAHMMSKMELSPEELETVKVSPLPTTVITANGSIDTTEGATVYVKDLDMFVTVQLFEDTPAVFSLGRLFEENG